MEFKAVIGANYGDEGKGLITNFLAEKAIKENKSCLVVLNNGGAQRGHTVVKENDRHIFHHFGSGTLVGASTYITENFVVNPIQFIKEYEELGTIIPSKPKVLMASEALVTTPYDMIINQILCKYRKEQNSCGLGIWQTIKNKDTFRIKNLDWFINKIKKCRFNEIEEYLMRRYTELPNAVFEEEGDPTDPYTRTKIKYIIKSYINGINIENLNSHWITDLIRMISKVEIKSSLQLKEDVNKFDTIIVENGQGILLDYDYDIQNGTPSKTNAKGVYHFYKDYIQETPKDIELIYVSRTYLTRHGKGNLIGEDLPAGVFNDKTNIYNEWQGNIRYAKLNYNEMMENVIKDTISFRDPHNTSIAFTHINEISLNDIMTEYDDRTMLKYISDSEDSVTLL